jgi:catechol 2,3-dioxygenase-like lactoylglutathione lyase family enzyme
MSIIQIEDIAYVRFSAPDVDEMRGFLIDFGLTPLPSEEGALYARGNGPSPFLHVTEAGPPAFVALGLRARSIAELERLAVAEGVQVDNLKTPGGGKIVRLIDPEGVQVEVVAGQANVAPMAGLGEAARNSAHSRARLHAPVRVPVGAANVVRLGHAVFTVTDFRASEIWYKDRFGLITSDEVRTAEGVTIGAFMRCNRGDLPTDHHTLLLFEGKTAAFGHVAFEVENVDDLMRGHAHLRKAGRNHAWGIGRHLLGSAIADYWTDPWGHGIEHWTDGDLFTVADGSRVATVEEAERAQWHIGAI